MSRQLFPHKILWLASYPKSGNTWFRAFLTALINNGEVDINNLISDGIFSARETFDIVADIDSRDLYDREAKLMLADVYRYVAAEKESLSIIKVHDAFETDAEGQNIIPEDVTQCAIYFIRNPLDIAASFANHLRCSIQDAVDMLNSDNAKMAPQPNNFNNNSQFRQRLSDWSNHVISWTTIPSFPVFVIKYEDMLNDTFATFGKALKFIGWNYTTEEIQHAIAVTSFEMLREQEAQKGFKETIITKKFFRSGVIGNWVTELTEDQIEAIKSKHENIIQEYQYTSRKSV